MKQWPESWAINDTDVAFGRELLQVFEEFLTELYMQGLSARTINRHKGNLWVTAPRSKPRRVFPIHLLQPRIVAEVRVFRHVG